MGRPSPRQLALWFGTWAVLQVALVSGPTLLRARGFGFSNFDLGIYSQALAQLALDPPNPLMSGRQLHVFNDHFDPILFLVAPWTRLFPAPAVGIVAEALFALAALLPLAWLGREGRLSLRALWLLGGLLAFGPGVTQALGFPFHPTTWAMAPMAWLLAALILERWGIALGALLLLLACKEEFPFVGVALTPYVFLRAPRRVTWTFLGVSLAWGLFALVLRPRVLGDVMPYASQPFRGLEQGVGAYLASRFSGQALAGMGDLIAPLLPLIVFTSLPLPEGERVGERANHRWLALALVPMLGIRFLSVAWRDHYGAVVVAAAVLVLAGLLSTRRLPWWVVASTLAILVAGNERILRRDFLSLTNRQGWSASVGCVDSPDRASAVRAAVERMRTVEGPLLASGNLLPWLAERKDVYAFGGPQPEGLQPRTVIMEKPPCGDTWAQSVEEREAALTTWRQRATNVLVDDAFVFAAGLPSP